MPVAPNVGTYSKFGLDTANPVTKAFEYLGALNFGKRGVVMSTDGIRGTRSHPVERTRDGIFTVGGSFATNPGPADLDTFLPLIAGGTKNVNDFALTETIPDFYVGIDKKAAMYTYAGCKMASAVFSGSQGSFLNLLLNIEGKTETPGAITGFSALVPSLQTPYVFHDGTLAYNGTSYQFKQFQVTHDNGLILDRFMNSQTRTDLPEADRNITCTLMLPFTSDTLALYNTGITSAAVILTFTNGSLFFTINMPAVQFPANPQDLPGRAEILLPLNGVARKTGTTLECLYSNKSS